ncbi:MAG: DUF2871 family protein [Desulfitobacteriaceae bacterium]
MGIRLIKISAVYLLIGLALGMFMSITKDFKLSSLHTHILVLGWALFAVIGIIHQLFPKASETVLAKGYFWLHNIGLPIMIVGLFVVLGGNSALEPVVAVGASLTTIGLILFIINVFRSIRN